MLERKIYGKRVRQFTSRMERVLYDAYRRMESERARRQLQPPVAEDVAVLSGPREWPDTTRQGTRVIDVVTGRAYLYEDGEFVRELDGAWTADVLTGDGR